MQNAVLKNGLKIIYKKKQGNAVVIQVMIKVGSNHEESHERGITHFLEHILFEGTKKRPTNRLISNEIEKIGGDFNAYTTNERTCFYVKVLKKHFSKAVEVLADILQNPLFNEEHIKKEKNIVLKEIDMIYDEPGYYQWILLQKSLFKKHPCKIPTYGDKNVIKKLTKKKVVDYFNEFYVPNNMVISIVGEIEEWKREIAKQFTGEKSKVRKSVRVKEPSAKVNTLKKVKKDIVNTYTILGFKTVPQDHPDSFVLEVINGVLGRGQSGRMFNEIRSKRGLAYDVGTQNIEEVSFGFFAIYATIDGNNLSLVKRLILEELGKLRKISKEELQEAKNYVEGSYLLDLEESQKVADQILFWEQIKNAKLMDKYLFGIKKVSQSDVRRVVDKYFKNYTQVVLEGKKRN